MYLSVSLRPLDLLEGLRNTWCGRFLFIFWKKWKIGPKLSRGPFVFEALRGLSHSWVERVRVRVFANPQAPLTCETGSEFLSRVSLPWNEPAPRKIMSIDFASKIAWFHCKKLKKSSREKTVFSGFKKNIENSTSKIKSIFCTVFLQNLTLEKGHPKAEHLLQMLDSMIEKTADPKKNEENA